VGLRLEGVREGKPADMAGLKGDTIIRMGDKEIKIFMLMEVWEHLERRHNKVVALRDGKEKEFEVKF
jgi:S1-C subfamily serine protease